MVMGSLMLGISQRKQNDEVFQREKGPRRNSTRRPSFDTRISDTPWSIDSEIILRARFFGFTGIAYQCPVENLPEQDRDHGGPRMSVMCPFPKRSASLQCMPWAYETYGWVSLEKNCWVIMEREWQMTEQTHHLNESSLIHPAHRKKTAK